VGAEVQTQFTQELSDVSEPSQAYQALLTVL